MPPEPRPPVTVTAPEPQATLTVTGPWGSIAELVARMNPSDQEAMRGGYTWQITGKGDPPASLKRRLLTRTSGGFPEFEDADA